ncbi:hypothetical protein BDP27DRAFT_1365483 [Rhodocollybia butyracea]|uniref:Protein kinase domain-containing protein n=1 Tax=Rhodocollybia butyracea TaxID=206335 RepID=A0A9P5U5H2_9AGAR|nr:hypothetical protein BDP27DRAFT_1365483 [Rhodocollybia butyracea]
MDRKVNVLQCFNLVLPVLSAIPNPIAGAVISALQEVLTAVQQQSVKHQGFRYFPTEQEHSQSDASEWGYQVDYRRARAKLVVFMSCIPAPSRPNGGPTRANLDDPRSHVLISSRNPNILDTVLETINVDATVTVTGMTALLERHDTGRIQLKDQELKFLRAGIARLNEQRRAGQVRIKSWTVTSWEVERGFLSWRWLGKSVGIIEMKDVDTTMKFVKAWKNLRSHRIQGFLGASTVDNPPFILVQPSHLSISEYVKVTAKPNVQRLILEVVRGLEYLHTRVPPVIHGECNRRRGNILIGSVGLGLDSLRIPETQRFALEQSLHRWTAPELLQKSETAPNAQTDIFSLGMIITELTNIVQERHPSTTLTLLSSIAEQCTAADPLTRPTISALVEQLTKPSSADQITDFLALMPSADNITELTGLQNIDQWRVVPYICRIPAVFWEKVDRLYVASAPLQGVHEHPYGNCFPSIAASPRDGTWTWIELALLREGQDGKRAQVNLKESLKDQPRGWMIEDTRYEIIRLPFADSTPRVHRVNLDWRNPFVKEARKGDVIALHPKARFPGWTNHIYSAEMHVVTE